MLPYRRRRYWVERGYLRRWQSHDHGAPLLRLRVFQEQRHEVPANPFLMVHLPVK